LIGNVADTAFWIAYYRGLEGERPDALFQDPLSLRLAGDRGRQIARDMPGGHFTAWSVVMRTNIIDDFIRLAISEGADTVLNLGAGLDTRPYRMELPRALSWIEVDYPHVIAFKEAQLQSERPCCDLRRVKLDLADRNGRKQMLEELDAKTGKMLVMTEGVVPYLSEDEAGSLADDIRSLDHAAYWVVDYLSPEAIKFRPRRMRQKMQNAPFKFEPEDWFRFFESHGWRSRDVRYFADEADRLKRPPQFPLYVKLLWAIRSFFMSRQRRDAFRTLAGYALLEPIG
jgi:methyltransferase (TIGR00027 family)